jgi:hypothetical protein
MNTYNVTLRYEDRKTGSEGKTVKVDASSISGAIGRQPENSSPDSTESRNSI